MGLRTGREWEQQLGHMILDHDGWRLNDGVSFNETLLTEEEYMRRYHMCTVKINNYRGDER